MNHAEGKDRGNFPYTEYFTVGFTNHLPSAV